MATVVKFKKTTDGKGASSFLMEISDRVEIVTCTKTGKSVCIQKRCQVPLSDEQLVQVLPGATLPGYIVKVKSKPYLFYDPDSKEELMLEHRYYYQPRRGAADMVGIPIEK